MADITEARKTLPGLVERLRADCDHIRYSCDDIDCVAGPIKKHVHALLDAHEQAESALAQAREENERLRQTSYLIDCMSLQARIKAALAIAAGSGNPDSMADEMVKALKGVPRG